MPVTAAFVDAMRESFGAEAINAAIRRGLCGSGEFYAAENGLEIGSRPVDVPGKSVNGREMAPPAWKGRK